MRAGDGDEPFIMHDDGLGWLWVPTGLKDGPLPTHYEPLESPSRNALYAQQVESGSRSARARRTIRGRRLPIRASRTC